MASKQHETVIDVGGTFQPGSKVEVHPRVQDTPPIPPLTKAVEKATVRQDGTVRVTGLEAFGPYSLYGVEKNVPRIAPGAAGKTTLEDIPRAISFNAAGPLPDDHTSQTGAAQVQALANESTATVRQSVPDHQASAGSTGRQFTRSGAITTNPPTAEQVGAENRPGESRQTGRADGVEDRPAEARRQDSHRDRPVTERQASADKRVRSNPRQRKASKPASPGRPSR